MDFVGPDGNIMSQPVPTDEESMNMKALTLRRDQIALLIGNGGETINALRRKSPAEVRIDHQRHEAWGKVTIIGPAGSIHETEQMITEAISVKFIGTALDEATSHSDSLAQSLISQHHAVSLVESAARSECDNPAGGGSKTLGQSIPDACEVDRAAIVTNGTVQSSGDTHQPNQEQLTMRVQRGDNDGLDTDDARSVARRADLSAGSLQSRKLGGTNRDDGDSWGDSYDYASYKHWSQSEPQEHPRHRLRTSASDWATPAPHQNAHIGVGGAGTFEVSNYAGSSSSSKQADRPTPPWRKRSGEDAALSVARGKLGYTEDIDEKSDQPAETSLDQASIAATALPKPSRHPNLVSGTTPKSSSGVSQSVSSGNDSGCSTRITLVAVPKRQLGVKASKSMDQGSKANISDPEVCDLEQQREKEALHKYNSGVALGGDDMKRIRKVFSAAGLKGAALMHVLEHAVQANTSCSRGET